MKLLSLGQSDETSLIDMYLHQKFLHSDQVFEGQLVKMTGCRIVENSIRTSASKKLLPTPYMIFYFDHEETNFFERTLGDIPRNQLHQRDISVIMKVRCCCCYVMLCFVMLCYVMLCYVMFFLV